MYTINSRIITTLLIVIKCDTAATRRTCSVAVPSGWDGTGAQTAHSARGTMIARKCLTMRCIRLPLKSRHDHPVKISLNQFSKKTNYYRNNRKSCFPRQRGHAVHLNLWGYNKQFVCISDYFAWRRLPSFCLYILFVFTKLDSQNVI